MQGVSCDLFNNGFWYVTTLSIGSIYDNSLQCSPNAHFTRHLFQLHHLKSLSFSNCFLNPPENPITIPTSNWYGLKNTLQTLDFRSNPGLTGPIPSDFSHLKNIQSLVLIENGLTGELPFKLGDLVNLRQLVLAGNRFVGPIPASLGGLMELLIFDSSRNFLSGVLPSAFGGLTSLLKLDLSNNLLEGVLPSEIAQLKNLTLLDLGINKFSGGLTKSLEEMVSLEELVLSNNPMGGDLIKIRWESFQNLEYLDLSNMGLIGKIPESMTKMRKLRFLGLNNNSLHGNVPPRFEAMPSISSLYLDGNDFGGKLRFAEWFYGKMRTHFRASNNPNLCCSVELMASRHVPAGVKICEKGNNSYSKDSEGKISKAFFEQINSHLVDTSGSLSCGFQGFWWGFVVREIVMALLWNVFL